jgi:hypothetical protein
MDENRCSRDQIVSHDMIGGRRERISWSLEPRGGEHELLSVCMSRISLIGEPIVMPAKPQPWRITV